jgi:hypothetical protein
MMIVFGQAFYRLQLMVDIEQIDTFGGIQTPSFRTGRGYAAFSINPEQTPGFSPGCRRIDFKKSVVYNVLILD